MSALTLSTEHGEVVIRLLEEQAPASVAHIRALVEQLAGADGCFYRAQRREHWLPGRQFEIVQGGWPLMSDLPCVDHEVATLPHRRGTVSLARGEPGTATGEFFVCLDEDAPALDQGAPSPMDGHGFSVFGQVVDGMDVLERIHSMPTDPEHPEGMLRGQLLLEPVTFRASI